MIERGRAALSFPLAFGGSLAGAWLLLLVRPDALRPVVLALLVGVALFVGLRRSPPRAEARVPAAWLLPVAGAWSLLLVRRAVLLVVLGLCVKVAVDLCAGAP